MSCNSLMKDVVCEIPDCTTTHEEVQKELQTFLESYCSVCEKQREGKLCGCAFPCSLTFRSHMLRKIYQILRIPIPENRRAVQVCFKHPDLLKQAREACVSMARASEEAGSQKKTEIPQQQQQQQQQQQPKMLKIRFGSTFTLGEPNLDDEEEFEEIPPPLNQVDATPNSSSELITPHSEESQQKMTKIKFNLGEGHHNSSSSDEDEEEAALYFRSPSSMSSSSCPSVSPSHVNDLSKMLRIHYRDYHQIVLLSQIKELISPESHLNDTVFITKDRKKVYGNSLILGSLSPFLREILSGVPVVDKFTTVIIPDITAAELSAFLDHLFDHDLDLRKIKKISSILKVRCASANSNKKSGKVQRQSESQPQQQQQSTKKVPLKRGRPRKVKPNPIKSDDPIVLAPAAAIPSVEKDGNVSGKRVRKRTSRYLGEEEDKNQPKKKQNNKECKRRPDDILLDSVKIIENILVEEEKERDQKQEQQRQEHKQNQNNYHKNETEKL